MDARLLSQFYQELSRFNARNWYGLHALQGYRMLKRLEYMVARSCERSEQSVPWGLQRGDQQRQTALNVKMQAPEPKCAVE